MTSVQSDKQGQKESETAPRSRPHRVKGAHIITERIEVGVPVGDAFDHWRRYEEWQRIFKKESAQQDGDESQVKVKAKIGPSQREWQAEIIEEERPHRISWRARGGLQAYGTTSFHSLSDRLTKVMVEIEYRPSGAMETVGNFFRMPRRRVRRDLRLFKNYVELGKSDSDSGSGSGEEK